MAVGAKHHSAYHRLLATARWSLDEMGLAVAQLLIAAQPAEEMIMLALDDTCRSLGAEFYSFQTDRPLSESVTLLLHRRAARG